MNVKKLPIQNAFVISHDLKQDERGSFERLFCVEEFKQNNLQHEIKQVNRSYNKQKGTFRGMHFQTKPHEEAKLVQCILGSVYDVILDLRKESPSYLQWHSVELSVKHSLALYIPEGVAHGFLTLEEHSTVLYHMFHEYDSGHASGVRWDDPAFGIQLPMKPSVISEKDASFPLYHNPQE